tara:strand:- start:239 stop:850 length:612 start_codon:yes stop_codon:yes gene_type:complete
LITDPYFYLVAIPAIMIYGISKGGFAGGLGVIAVPLMALVVSPLQAAAILLPILCAMDLVALWTFRGQWVWPELKLIIPASFIGIASGTLLFSEMSPAIILLLLGTISIVFTLHHWLQHLRSGSARQKNFGPVIGIMAAAISGLTSFVAHAGGPPLRQYRYCWAFGCTKEYRKNFSLSLSTVVYFSSALNLRGTELAGCRILF